MSQKLCFATEEEEKPKVWNYHFYGEVVDNILCKHWMLKTNICFRQPIQGLALPSGHCKFNKCT